MSFLTVTRDIELRLNANWATTVIDINENVDFTPPNYDTPYVKLRIFGKATERKNVGNPSVHRRLGVISVEVFTPLNTGTRLGQEYAETIGAIFRDQTFNGITCREAAVKATGEHEGRWATVVAMKFKYDDNYVPPPVYIELIPDPSFDDPAAWFQIAGGGTVSGGQLTYLPSGAQQGTRTLPEVFAPANGVEIFWEVDVDAITGGFAGFNFGGVVFHQQFGNPAGLYSGSFIVTDFTKGFIISPVITGSFAQRYNSVSLRYLQ